MLYKIWEYKKIRFICVGTFNSILDLLILNTLVFGQHFPIWAANTISVSIGITLSYFLNHFIVFKHRHRPTPGLFVKFFLLTGVSSVILQDAVIYLSRPVYQKLIQHVSLFSVVRVEDKISLNLAKITAILIGMTWNYLFYSHVVFKQLSDKKDTETV
jgi:putative flippase GtrA